MRKPVLIPLVLGLILLMVGVAKSYSSAGNSRVISCSGTIRDPYKNETSLKETQPQQTTSTTQLDIVGFLTIITSLVFFTLAYMNNRSPCS